MSANPHFASAASWEAAEQLLTFTPRQPRRTAGFELEGLRIHVRDHKQRELPIGKRTLEAHYGGFVLSQARKVSAEEARRQALEVSYGAEPYEARIAGREGRAYDHGEEPPPGDIDGRMPAVVVWHDDDMLLLVASGELGTDVLVEIAMSMYAGAEECPEKGPWK